nr:reverse transcriptase domain-containing protein [Tanacetum cinerariifolium]
MFLEKYFPPSMVTKLRNEITNFCQRSDEPLFKVWERYKVSIDRSQQSESSSSITSSSDTKIAALKAEMAKINKNLMRVLQVNQHVKAVTPNCETCGSPHSFNDYPATVGQTQNVYAAGAYQGSGTLPGNTITNPKEELKGITTRSGTAYQGPMIPTTSSSLPSVVELQTEATKDTVHPTNNESTKDVQPLVVPTESPVLNSEPIVAPIIDLIVSLVSAPKPNQRPLIPYPSKLHDQMLRDKANDKRDKFFQIFKDLNFNISFTDALILMPKFGPTIKTFLTNKDRLYELARTSLNKHCSAVLLKKFLEKLGDPGKFLIPLWNKLLLPDLSPTYMNLELADHLISRPVRVVEDVFIKLGTFHFSTDFVVVDFDADPRVPLILGIYFLKFGRALIDVFKGELTLRVGKEAITFNLDQTSRYSTNYNDMTANQIDVIDMGFGGSSPNLTSSNLKRRNRRRSKQPLILEGSPIDTMADQRTMVELLHALTEGYAEAIMVPPILTEHFELKHSLNNMMTSDQFFGLEKDNPHDHIRCFNKITSIIKYKDVPNSAIKLMLFPFSLKDLLRACPHHGFFELHQLDTFYNALNPADQDSLNSTAGGNLLERRTHDVLTIIKNKSKNMMASFFQMNTAFTSSSRPLPSNTIANLKGKLKAITTQSGLVLDGPSVPMPSPFINPKEDEHVEETLGTRILLSIPLRSHLLLSKKLNLLLKKKLCGAPNGSSLPQYPLSFKDAQAKKMLKALFSNKEKLLELENTPLNENCLAVILKKLPEKLGDPGNLSLCVVLDYLEDLFATNHLSGNPTFSSHTDLTSSKAINPLSGSTTSSSSNHLLEEFVDEIALITFPSGNDDLPFDIESDLKEIEYLLNHDPTKEMDSILEDSVDKDNLTDPNNNLFDTILEMFTDKHALDYSSPLLYDDLDEFESDNKYVYDDLFDCNEEKSKSLNS